MTEYYGGCSCGGVRYKLLDEPMFTHACHCHLCQQATGSAFIIHNIIEGCNFVHEKGELAEFEGPSGSGRKHVVKRCRKCGDPIVSYFGETQDTAIIKAGSLDDPNEFPPQAHIFVNKKLDWVKCPDKIPQYQEFYDFKEAWPADSMKRRLVILGKQATA